MDHFSCLGWDKDPVEVHGKTIIGFYRSKSLPKEMEYYDDYESEVGAELTKAEDIFRGQVGTWIQEIQSLDVGLEDKDWVSITVTLK